MNDGIVVTVAPTDARAYPYWRVILGSALLAGPFYHLLPLLIALFTGERLAWHIVWQDCITLFILGLLFGAGFAWRHCYRDVGGTVQIFAVILPFIIFLRIFSTNSTFDQNVMMTVLSIKLILATLLLILTVLPMDKAKRLGLKEYMAIISMGFFAMLASIFI